MRAEWTCNYAIGVLKFYYSNVYISMNMKSRITNALTLVYTFDLEINHLQCSFLLLLSKILQFLANSSANVDILLKFSTSKLFRPQRFMFIQSLLGESILESRKEFNKINNKSLINSAEQSKLSIQLTSIETLRVALFISNQLNNMNSL